MDRLFFAVHGKHHSLKLFDRESSVLLFRTYAWMAKKSKECLSNTKCFSLLVLVNLEVNPDLEMYLQRLRFNH